jgi:hypothetical protein
MSKQISRFNVPDDSPRTIVEGKKNTVPIVST